jgi:hypothetical protein
MANDENLGLNDNNQRIHNITFDMLLPGLESPHHYSRRTASSTLGHWLRHPYQGNGENNHTVMHHR